MTEAEVRKNWWQRRNWWKIGFFVMLVLFEFTREWAVLASNNNSRIAVAANVANVGTYTTATGQWVRTDGGGRLVPTAVLIECDQDRAECMEVSTHLATGYVGTPTIDRFQAQFAPDIISYENDNPRCAHYTVRIDLKLEKVIALRKRKDGPFEATCDLLEDRVEMTLADSSDQIEDPFEGHFVPLMSGLAGLVKMLS